MVPINEAEFGREKERRSDNRTMYTSQFFSLFPEGVPAGLRGMGTE